MIEGKHLLVDGDLICHRSAAIAEPVRYLVTDTSFKGAEFNTSKEAQAYAKVEGNDCIVWSRKEDKGLEFAQMVTKKSIESIVEKLKPSGMTMFISGRYNFRYAVATTKPYKGHRDYMARPKYLRDIKEYLTQVYGSSITDGIEADDAIGCRSTELGEECVIVSTDKDLDQLAGWHYNWVQGRSYRVGQRQADTALFHQILTGDPTDDIPGVSGVGKKTADGILSGASGTHDLFLRTWQVYRDRVEFPSDEAKWDYFREQSRLCYILRHWDDRFEQIPGYVTYDEIKEGKCLSLTGGSECSKVVG